MRAERKHERPHLDYTGLAAGNLRGSVPRNNLRPKGKANMSSVSSKLLRAAALLAMLSIAIGANAAEIGRIKVVKGKVTIERDGNVVPAIVGSRVQSADKLMTGADGSVGITMDDDSVLSAGPNSVLSLERYAFDPTTNQGRFDAALNKGTLSVISGRIAKQSPDAMTVRTPAILLGVRGTTFAVSAPGD
jgi:hypothetical protein